MPEACILLGGMSPRTWARWKEGIIGRTDRDLRMRMAHLMGIGMGLRYVLRETARGYAWIRNPTLPLAANRPSPCSGEKYPILQNTGMAPWAA